MELQNETRPPHDMKPATHPFGSVLLRLELALAMICAGRRRACPAEVEGRIAQLAEPAFQHWNSGSKATQQPGKACSAKEKISIFIRVSRTIRSERHSAVIPSIVAGSLD